MKIGYEKRRPKGKRNKKHNAISTQKLGRNFERKTN